MERNAILLLASLAGSSTQLYVMPEWAERALDAGFAEPYVEFRYEVRDDCSLDDLRIVAAHPDDQWRKGDKAELLEMTAAFIGPFDSSGSHEWPLVKETTELARFEPADYESRLISIHLEDGSLTAECVFRKSRGSSPLPLCLIVRPQG